MKKNIFDLKLKESDIAFIGVAATIVLYIMNVLGTGVIVGGDIGHIDTEIPFYGFLAPVIFTAFATFTGYFTKRHSMNKAFVAIYITLLLPFASYLPAVIGIYLPFMFLCMPVSSLFTYLHDEICELMGVASYSDTGTLILAFIIVLMLIPLIIAPLVYRFTQEKED